MFASANAETCADVWRVGWLAADDVTRISSTRSLSRKARLPTYLKRYV